MAQDKFNLKQNTMRTADLEGLFSIVFAFDLTSQLGIEMIAPYRGNRRKDPTQDGRKLWRYKRRWKIERLFAYLQDFRRLVVRCEYHAANFIGMVQLGSAVILLRYF